MNNEILFIYNWVVSNLKQEQYIECSSTSTIEAIKKSLKLNGYKVIPLNLLNPEQLITYIKAYKPTFAYVTAEGFLDYPETLFDGLGCSMIREILEEMNVPYSHSSPIGMSNCRNKNITTKILSSNNVLVPNSYTLPAISQLSSHIQAIEEQISYPMFVKPNGGGNSIGIDEKSIVYSKNDLISKSEQLFSLLGDQSLIIEKFLPGREYTVGIIGNAKNIVLPIVAFPNNYQVRSYEIKKIEAQNKSNLEIIYHDDPIYHKLYPIAIDTFSALGVRDLIRVDIKEDANGIPMVIDVNGTPSLAQGASLPFMCAQIGLSHIELISLFLWVSLKRYKIPPTCELLKTMEIVNDKLKNYIEFNAA